MQFQNAALLFALLLPLTACGGEQDSRSLISAGNTELASGHYAGAVTSFESALAGNTTGDSGLKKDATLGLCEALAYIDSSKSKSEFLALANQGGLDYSAYNRVAVALASASKFGDAVALLTDGMEKFPTEPKFEKLRDKIGKAAESAGDSAAMKALEGLGYVGN